MTNMSDYYLDNKENLMSDVESYVVGKKYRFTILTKNLIRLEYSKSGVFENRASELVINRKFPKVKYSITESESMIQINTGVFTLNYVKDSELKSSVLNSNINVIINRTKVEWQMNNSEIRNLKGINYSIDSLNNKMVLDKGLYSLDGYVLLDDSDSKVLDNTYFTDREKDSKDYYLFVYDNDFSICLNDYFHLTGYPSLIPRYALGVWWYKNDNYTENDINNLVTNFTKENIPLSVFMLGDCWHDADNNYIPSINLSNISSYLNKLNIKLGVTINPKKEIISGTREHQILNNYLKTDKMSFIPFTNDKIMPYFNVFVNNLENNGVNLFSIDYNNKLDKNSLFMLNHYHYGLNELKGKRGLILSRNPGIAQHRYPIMWTGKTKVNWETLSYLPSYNIQGYNIGVSFIAHPIGGYYGGIEESELYLRYIQFATFSPIFLLASEGGKYYKREPWKWNPSIQNIIVYYMHLRYKLIPYLYNASYIYHQTGEGIIKPLYYDNPKLLDMPTYKNEYMFGNEILVAPIINKKNSVIARAMRKIYFPTGIWFDFFKGKRYNGNKIYTNFYRDEDYPVFVKAGSIIPISNDKTDEIPKTLELLIYPLSSGNYVLYEDDGISKNFEHGFYMMTEFNYAYKLDDYTFKISKKEGKNLLDNRNYILRFKNIKNISNININDNLVKYKYHYDGDDFVVEIYDFIVGRELTINIMGKDTFVSRVSYIKEEIKDTLFDLPIETILKEKIDEILFSELEIRKKRIKLRKLKRKGLETKYIKVFINLLEYIEKI